MPLRVGHRDHTARRWNAEPVILDGANVMAKAANHRGVTIDTARQNIVTPLGIWERMAQRLPELLNQRAKIAQFVERVRDIEVRLASVW